MLKRIFQIILLILAGEAVFILPFVLTRIFRPTVLEVFALSNTELGACFSIYGLVAMVSYVLGGGLADRFAPRYLIAAALVLTAAGGFYLASYPSFEELLVLYGYWGFTTIFLFWAAMVKATRIWGGSDKQGLAFGLLDGGRGAVSYLFGVAGIVVFYYFSGTQIEYVNLADRKESFSQVIYFCSIVILIIAVLAALFVSNPKKEVSKSSERILDTLKNYVKVLRIPAVYLLMIIILCGYSGYKITDVYSLYANEIMGYNEVKAAKVGANMLGIRIFIGVIAGLLADRFTSGRMMLSGFLVTFLGALLFALGWVQDGDFIFFLIAIISTAVGVYAIRTLYFAAVQEGNIPLAVTGTAVGVISLLGYTPDVFMGPLIGYFLDGYPGLVGFQLVFASLAGFSIIGAITSWLFMRLKKQT
ncbi:MFS transporter [Nonlabens spongiae]|uniref:MFS transporter n=1 Tax=Nonlabens spongiae TaxID=331648 RepID=A0A1W6MH48_9FLAO|nr:MFS transporter [Nonlabens spongiae]